MSTMNKVTAATFPELCEHLRARYTVLAMRGEAMTLRWTSAEQPHAGQAVFLHHARVQGTGCLIMAVELGPEDRMDVHAALAEALRLPVGALVRRDTVLALRHVMRGSWEVAQVIETVELMARGAQLLSEKLARRRYRPESLAMFAAYAA